MSGRSRQSGSLAIAERKNLHLRLRYLCAEERISLAQRLAESPDLAAAHRFVQRIFGVCDKRHLSPEQAKKRILRAWTDLPDSIKPHFTKFRTAITVRSNEFFSNWDVNAVTNGRTEAKNRTLRNLHRAGRGLRHDELRRRVIFTISPTEHLRLIKLGLPLPDPTATAFCSFAPSEENRKSLRHARHKSGRRKPSISPQQLRLFDP